MFASPLKIYTQNCKGIPFTDWRRRRREIINKIKELDPDVVFLQEIVLKNNLAHFALPGYEVVAVTGALFVKGGLVILSKLKIKNFYFQKFQAQGKIFSQQITDRFLGKGFLVAETEDGQAFINTHLVSFYSEAPKSDKNRTSQLRQLLATAGNYPSAIIGGDFNFTPDSEDYALARAFLKDAAEDLSPTFENHKVDYIFATGERATRRKTVVEGGFSDHKGIFIEF